jgi:hypothetical protein
MTKQFITYLASIVIVVGAAFGGWHVLRTPLRHTTSPQSGAQNQTTSPDGQTSESAIDWADDRVLVGASHNVFVGKVVAEVGSKKYPWAMNPTIEFAVHPIVNIKGNLQEETVIGQFKGSDPLLEVGSTYIFASRYHAEDNLYSIGVYPYDYRMLTQDVNSSDAQIKVLAQNNDIATGYQKAYTSETGFPYDIKHNAAYNSYASRHYDAQGNLIDDTVVLHEQYMAAHPSTSTEAAPAAESVSPAPDQSTTPDATPSAVQSDTTSPAPSDAPTDTPVQS